MKNNYLTPEIEVVEQRIVDVLNVSTPFSSIGGAQQEDGGAYFEDIYD